MTTCGALRDSLHREVDALEDVQRLVLDDHLAGCARCRGDRERLLAVHRIGAALPVPADARTHQRAIARALLEGPSTRFAPAPRSRRALIPLALAGAGAILLAAVLVLRPGDGELAAPLAIAPPAPPPATVVDAAPADAPSLADDVVEDGELAHDGVAVTTVPARQTLRAMRATQLRLAGARVIVAASSELRWVPEERTVLLERGRLDITNGANGIARVVAGRVDVEVGDADVTVEPTGVRVTRGAVAIREGARVVRLEAGGAASFEAPARPTPQPQGPPVAELLAVARTRFAAKDLAGAERAAAAALAARPSRADAAAARMLLADIAQASGALDRAVAHYTAVFTELAGLPAAESALYATARVELRRTRTAAARALLARYLDRHPAGRYTDDVRRQLAALPKE
ncbi:MAG: hypothetical protein KF773_22150 [Deltaproteobacteria bacterium]|nr:hypothetical protein [Deltaproteobacteria bacterium]